MKTSHRRRDPIYHLILSQLQGRVGREGAKAEGQGKMRPPFETRSYRVTGLPRLLRQPRGGDAPSPRLMGNGFAAPLPSGDSGVRSMVGRSKAAHWRSSLPVFSARFSRTSTVESPNLFDVGIRSPGASSLGNRISNPVFLSQSAASPNPVKSLDGWRSSQNSHPHFLLC